MTTRPFKSAKASFALSGRKGVAGSSRSKYVLGLARAIPRAKVVLPHCRGPSSNVTGYSRTERLTRASRSGRPTADGIIKKITRQSGNFQGGPDQAFWSDAG